MSDLSFSSMFADERKRRSDENDSNDMATKRLCESDDPTEEGVGPSAATATAGGTGDSPRTSSVRETSRKFKTEWLTLFPWAFVDSDAVFCRLCIEMKQKNVFTAGKPVGMRPKKDDFLKHEQGSGHKMALLATSGSVEEDGKTAALNENGNRVPRHHFLQGDFGKNRVVNPFFRLANLQDTGALSAGETSEEELKTFTCKYEEIDCTAGSEGTKEDASTATASNVVVPPKIPEVKRDSSDAIEVVLKTLTELANRIVAEGRSDEFHHFGMNVASQLRSMPLRAAVETQLEIQKVLTAKRLQSLD